MMSDGGAPATTGAFNKYVVGVEDVLVTKSGAADAKSDLTASTDKVEGGARGRLDVIVVTMAAKDSPVPVKGDIARVQGAMEEDDTVIAKTTRRVGERWKVGLGTAGQACRGS